jgi:hypothetical protein
VRAKARAVVGNALGDADRRGDRWISRLREKGRQTRASELE